MKVQSSLGELGRSFAYTAVTVVLLGFVYPLFVAALAHVAFPRAAAGSLIADERGRIVGSDLSGQLFTSPRYFHGRPSAAGSGYDPLSSSGTNLGPTSAKLIAAAKATIASASRENGGGVPPMDLVTSSASGLDPDVSPEAAEYQVERVAKARALPIERIRALVAAYVRRPAFGVFGEPRVNVLALNRALDAQGARP